MENVIDHLGGPAAVARLVNCKPPSVIGWRRRSIPADRCPALEKASLGKYPCEQLRPDVMWHRVPDSAWPWHPQGRPLIDVSRPAEPNTTTQETRDAA